MVRGIILLGPLTADVVKFFLDYEDFSNPIYFVHLDFDKCFTLDPKFRSLMGYRTIHNDNSLFVAIDQ